MRFAIAEALLLAQQGISVDAGAHQLLRCVSRHRQGLERAVDHIREGSDGVAEDRITHRAVAMLERALTIGLFY